jgi:integrase
MIGLEEIRDALSRRGKTLLPLLDYDEIFVYAKYIWKKSGSIESLRTSLYAVRDFLNYIGLNPKELIMSINNGDIDIVKALNEYIDYLFFNKRLKASTIRNGRIPYIKTFLKKNRISISMDDLDLPSVYKDTEDRIPTKDELKDLINTADLKTKAIILILISSGIRIGVLTKLKLRNIDFDSEPIKIVIPAELNKGKRKYFTFITPEASNILRLYLDHRKKKEKLTENSHLFTTKYGTPYSERVLEEVLRRHIKRHIALKRLEGTKDNRYDIHIHSFRKFFKTMLEISGVKRSFIEFLMGHKGPYLNESYFRPFEEDVKNEYKKAIPNLTIIETVKQDIEELRKQQLLDIAKLLGFPEEKIKKMEDILAKSRNIDEAIEEIKKLNQEVNNPKRDILVIHDETELIKYLGEGWRILRELSDGRIIIER